MMPSSTMPTHSEVITGSQPPSPLPASSAGVPAAAACPPAAAAAAAVWLAAGVTQDACAGFRASQADTSNAPLDPSTPFTISGGRTRNCWLNLLS